MKLRLMTVNVWGDYFGNPVQPREGAFVEAFQQYAPDVIGLQEMTRNWYMGSMFSGLQERYAIVGTSLGAHENYVPLAYDKNRFELVETGFRHYSHTPDFTKGYTYVVLAVKESGQTFAVCNTHFWWKTGAEHDLIRLENAAELAGVMQRLRTAYHCPVFAMGDMNTHADSTVFEALRAQGILRLHGLAQEAHLVSSDHGDPVRGEDGRYHGRRTENPETQSLDHIVGLFDACEVLAYQLVLDQAVLDASDHSPLYADVVLKLI